ncbi:hypothetical protein GCK32_007489 [Trichostrongylus colubriformis]|uniref:Uncharacterized protein n=1 Tax=Trichostrongylus colubriformis TaxID=6319 RepID=A0AAN8ISV6_TRICO
MSAFIFVEVCSYICTPLSIASNVLILMIIRNTTSRQLTSYKLPLAMFAFSSILLSLTFLFCQPCVLLNNDVILIVLLSPTCFIHPAVTSFCFVLFQATMIFCTLQVASPYLFKMLAKKEETAKKWQIGSIVMALAVIWLVIMVPLIVFSFQTYDDIHEREEVHRRIVKDYTRFDQAPCFVAYKLHAITKVWLIMVAVTCSIGCLTVAVNAVLSSGLMRIPKLSKWATHPSVGFSQIANTSRLNACSMALMVVTPIALFTVFAVSGQPTYSYSIPLFLGSAFIPILNAYFVLFNVRAFRRAMSKIISFRGKSISTVSHISSDQ